MKTLFCFFKLLMVAAVTMIAVFLLSLPFFYFALTWENGIHSILLEDLFIGALAVAGFFCYRWLNRIFRDSGSGDLYLWSAILIVMIILFAFRDHSSYAVSLGRKIFPEGVLYKEMLVLDGGTIGENLVHLMKFSSLYITTYTAAFCFLMAVFGRCLWNQKMV